MTAENQMAIERRVAENVRKYQELLPDVGSAYEKLTCEVYKDGALGCKTKRLMALAVALTHGCKGCILFQTEQAIALGSSVEKTLETRSVAIYVGGTVAGGGTARVVQLLTELGIIE